MIPRTGLMYGETITVDLGYMPLLKPFFHVNFFVYMYFFFV